MSNYRRVTIPGGVYFFTVVTHERTPIFNSEARVDILRDAVKKVMKTRPFKIDAMVILPDHLHCIWRLPEGDSDFSSRWREIKKAASKRIGLAAINVTNALYGRGGFGSILSVTNKAGAVTWIIFTIIQ